MKSVELQAHPVADRDQLFSTITEAASLIDGYRASRFDADTLVLEWDESAFWLLGLFAPLFKRRHRIVVRLAGGQVTAIGTGSAAMAGFLGALLLGDPAPTLSPRLRELAAAWQSTGSTS